MQSSLFDMVLDNLFFIIMSWNMSIFTAIGNCPLIETLSLNPRKPDVRIFETSKGRILAVQSKTDRSFP